MTGLASQRTLPSWSRQTATKTWSNCPNRIKNNHSEFWNEYHGWVNVTHLCLLTKFSSPASRWIASCHSVLLVSWSFCRVGTARSSCCACMKTDTASKCNCTSMSMGLRANTHGTNVQQIQFRYCMYDEDRNRTVGHSTVSFWDQTFGSKLACVRGWVHLAMLRSHQPCQSKGKQCKVLRWGKGGQTSIY